MKINTKTRYGLRAMLEISLNKEGIYQKDIAKNQDLSFKYLDQIISILKSSGLITTVSGKKSGYVVAKDIEEITSYEIFKAFNAELNILDCISETVDCKRSTKCATQKFWLDLNNLIKEYMKSISLYDLSIKQAKINQQQQDLMFYI